MTHYRICRNTKNHRYYLVQSDGGRADNDYDSIDQLLTAYKIPEGMPSPAPLGIFVPRDATEVHHRQSPLAVATPTPPAFNRTR